VVCGGGGVMGCMMGWGVCVMGVGVGFDNIRII